MTDTPTDHGRLLDEAIDLIIRQQNDPDNPVSEELIRAWRGRSRQHEDIWARVARVHGASGTILNEQRRIERSRNLGIARRNFMLGGLGILGLGTAAYSFAPGMLTEARADHVTDKGEIRRINLPDGSIATLGPDSAIAVNFDSARREIELLTGMCFLEVAKGLNRPLSAVCAHLRATTLGSTFDISNDRDSVTVAVDNGLVDVQASNPLVQASVQLEQGQWLTMNTDSGRIDRGRMESGQVAAWRDNLIIADRETVNALVTRIGRWLPGRIVIADPSVGTQRVSGIFDLTDPLRTLEAVVHPTGARVRQVTSFVTIISPL